MCNFVNCLTAYSSSSQFKDFHLQYTYSYYPASLFFQNTLFKPKQKSLQPFILLTKLLFIHQHKLFVKFMYYNIAYTVSSLNYWLSAESHSYKVKQMERCQLIINTFLLHSQLILIGPAVIIVNIFDVQLHSIITTSPYTHGNTTQVY